MSTSDPKSRRPGKQGSGANLNVKAEDIGGLFIDQGSPILIGGGSVNINFEEGEQHWVPVAGSPGTFVLDADEIETIMIVNENHVMLNNLRSVVKGKSCLITIHTDIAGATPSAIRVSSEPGVEMRLSFDAAQFLPLATDPDRPHFNQDRKLVDMLEILDRVSGETLRFAIPPRGVGLIGIFNSK